MPILESRIEFVGADRNIAGDIVHVIVHADVPAQQEHRYQVAEAAYRVAQTVGAQERHRYSTRRRRASQAAVQIGAHVAVRGQYSKVGLAAEHRRRKRVVRKDETEVAGGVDAPI